MSVSVSDPLLALAVRIVVVAKAKVWSMLLDLLLLPRPWWLPVRHEMILRTTPAYGLALSGEGAGGMSLGMTAAGSSSAVTSTMVASGMSPEINGS